MWSKRKITLAPLLPYTRARAHTHTHTHSLTHSNGMFQSQMQMILSIIYQIWTIHASGHEH